VKTHKKKDMKKNIIIIIAMIFIVNITTGQNRAIKQFYKKYDRSEESITKFNVNSWMMGLGKLVLKMADDGTDEMKLAIKLSGDVKKGKFMVIEKEKASLKEDIKHLMKIVNVDNLQIIMNFAEIEIQLYLKHFIVRQKENIGRIKKTG